MNTFRQMICVSCAVVALATPGCSSKRLVKVPVPESQCASNLHEIAILLRLSIPTAPNYPSSLAELKATTTNTSLFVCPATGHKPGRMSEVERWSDYIYVANLPDLMKDTNVPLLICPPTNHGGEDGFVIWLATRSERIRASDINRLVDAPWGLATNADEIMEIRKGADVRVPLRLQTIYPNAFRQEAQPN